MAAVRRTALQFEPLENRFPLDGSHPTVAIEWSLPQPTEHSALQIAALGDSQTTEIDNSYVPPLRQHLSSDRYSISIFAQGGYRVNDVRNLWVSQVKDADYDLAVIFAGINDVAATDQTAQSIFVGLQTMFNEALARGMQVVTVGVTPWSQNEASTAIKRSTTVELNALMAQYVADHPANMRFIDAYAELSAEQDTQRLATRYDSGDGLHLSVAGDRRLATLVAEAIESLRQPVEQAAAVDLLFSEPVTELLASDFQLTLDGQPASFQLLPISSTTLRLEFALSSGQQNQVELALSPATTVSDLTGNLLTGATAWSVASDQLSPQASLSLDVPAVSADTVTQITVDFSEPIEALDIGDFQLIGPEGSIDLQSAVLTAMDADSYALSLDNLAQAPGSYRLILAAGSSQIKDLHANPLERSSVVDWVRLPSAVTTSAGLVTFPGTNGLETIELNIHAETIEYWINGMMMEHSLQDVERVVLTPLGGRDIVAIQWMRDSNGDGGEPVNAPLIIEALSSDSIDTISLFGTEGDDGVSAAPLNVTLSNNWFTASAVGFTRV
ncbi:MAG: SGNH/GDSL hydrolase family protein, partial [Pirellulaceae bacterium]|nr:SGNH/GDSL hydrolase family protein [Pirellulaceae bacterium]